MPDRFVADTSGREITTTRTLDARREFVWRAWAEPEHLAEWWGPQGFTNTFREFDFRPGGHWRFVMCGPDGATYENHSVFLEVVPPARIVFRHLEPIHLFQMTVTFEEIAGGTRLTWRMLFETAAECHTVEPFVREANEQNFDRLENELARMREQV